MNLRREFAARGELIDYLKSEFPYLTRQDQVSEFRGGRIEALKRLEESKLQSYARTRNRLDGDVTRLSPYIRHGVLELAEVRDYALSKNAPEKFINELGWRDYWQRLYRQIGHDIWIDLEEYKTGFSASHYADQLPEDIRSGETGTVMDLFIQELLEEGYVHNHARMYLAAYVVHWRQIKWQAGAAWFLEHLLDGDPASNNLSWQWVASTFSHKPYFFNADNLRKNVLGAYPQLKGKSLDPFEGSYDELERRLFPHKPRGGRR